MAVAAVDPGIRLGRVLAARVVAELDVERRHLCGAQRLAMKLLLQSTELGLLAAMLHALASELNGEGDEPLLRTPPPLGH